MNWVDPAQRAILVHLEGDYTWDYLLESAERLFDEIRDVPHPVHIITNWLDARLPALVEAPRHIRQVYQNMPANADAHIVIGLHWFARDLVCAVNDLFFPEMLDHAWFVESECEAMEILASLQVTDSALIP